MIESRLAEAAVELLKEKYVSVEDAISAAAEQGINLSQAALIGALISGDMLGLRKARGRWEMPESEFTSWLARHKEKE
jgi:hypothetical protein